MQRLVLIGLLLALTACGQGDAGTASAAAPAAAAALRWQTGQAVCAVDGQTLRGDLVQPAAGAHRRRGLLFVHGGGWSAGSRADYAPLMQALAEQGYTGLSVDYRLSPTVRHPAHLQDVKCALRWLQGRAAELDIDADRLAVIGGSAGAHLAALLAFTSGQPSLEGSGLPGGSARPVAAAVLHGGPHDLSVLDGLPAEARGAVHALLGSATPDAAQLRAASPVTALRPGLSPPVLILHGGADPLVPPDQAHRLAAALQAVGAPHRLFVIPGAGHADFGREPDAVGRLLMDFLATELR